MQATPLTSRLTNPNYFFTFVAETPVLFCVLKRLVTCCSSIASHKPIGLNRGVPNEKSKDLEVKVLAFVVLVVSVVFTLVVIATSINPVRFVR